MKLHKGEVLFHQVLMNIIGAGEVIPHHSLVSPNLYHGTAIALVTCEIERIPSHQWYSELEQHPERYREIALLLQDKLKMMQQRIDQLTQLKPIHKLEMLQTWFDSSSAPASLTDILTQDEIAQLIGLRRETVNRLLRTQSTRLPAGPKNS